MLSARRAALLFALLGAFAILKGRFDPQVGRRPADADYYYGIARSVAAGEGLRSNLSLYYQGFKELPHRVNQSPLWPLLLGYAGRVWGLEGAAMWLPELLYYADLLLLYFLANRLASTIGGGRPGLLFRPGAALTLGHVAVLLLGANPLFFTFTSLPYTEALAFLWLFATLLALDRTAREASAGWALVTGVFAGLALLTRPQMVGAACLVPAVLLMARRSQRQAAIAASGTLAVLTPWVIYLASWLEPLTLGNALGLASLQETPEVAPFEHQVAVSGAWAYVRDRLDGLLIALHPWHPHSYEQHFGWLVYLVPLAALHAGWRWRGSLRRGPRWLEPRHVLAVATVGTGIGLLLPLHALHMSFYLEWLFGHRQGLPLVLLVIPALAYLDGERRGFIRIGTAAILAVSAAMSGARVAEALDERFDPGLAQPGRELVAWLDAQEPPPAVVTAKSHKLSIHSRSGFHWMLCRSSPETTLGLLEHAGADYVLVFPSERRCVFHRGIARGRLEHVRAFGKGRRRIDVYALRAPRADSRPPPRSLHR